MKLLGCHCDKRSGRLQRTVLRLFIYRCNIYSRLLAGTPAEINLIMAQVAPPNLSLLFSSLHFYSRTRYNNLPI
jgi:hypothetical protein